MRTSPRPGVSAPVRSDAPAPNRALAEAGAAAPESPKRASRLMAATSVPSSADGSGGSGGRGRGPGEALRKGTWGAPVMHGGNPSLRICATGSECNLPSSVGIGGATIEMRHRYCVLLKARCPPRGLPGPNFADSGQDRELHCVRLWESGDRSEHLAASPSQRVRERADEPATPSSQPANQPACRALGRASRKRSSQRCVGDRLPGCMARLPARWFAGLLARLLAGSLARLAGWLQDRSST